MRLRSQLALSGLVGVGGGGALIAGALYLARRSGLAPLVTGPAAWALLGLLLCFSLAEIPLMIFGLRQMAAGPSGTRLAVLTNAAFTFFAAVYAVPFLLLTGRVGISLALTSLCLVRFAGAVWFVFPGDGHLGK